MTKRSSLTPAPTSRLTRKGQVTIPLTIRRLLGIGPNDTVAFEASADGVRLRPVGGVVARTAGMLRGEVLALTPGEERDSAELAMAEEAESGGRTVP